LGYFCVNRREEVPRIQDAKQKVFDLSKQKGASQKSAS
jgi:hypothetical protein